MKVDRKGLLASCEVVKPALRASTSMPALAFLWFRGGYVYAYDGGLGIACALPAGVDNLEGGVHGSTFMQLLGSSPKEAVDIAMEEDGFEIKLGGAKAKLAITPVNRFFWNFPDKAPSEGEPLLKISEDVLKAIKAVLPIKHESPNRVEHHSVMVKPGKTSTFFYTTDSRSAARFVVMEPSGLEELALIPRSFAEQLIKHAKADSPIWATKEAHSLYAGQSPGQIQVHSNSLDSGDDIVDIAKVVSTHEKLCGDGVIIPEGFAEALGRAEILAGKDEAVVILQSWKDGLGVTGSWSSGQLDETLHLTEGESWGESRVKVNVNLIKRALPMASHIALSDKSMLLYGDDGRYTYVLAGVD